ncbi:MAG: hypothetical protein Q7J10_10285 [Methanosarcinaceae archaeon]|nr:hypothetical protein [Methanosarcinaceae archaeon]
MPIDIDGLIQMKGLKKQHFLAILGGIFLLAGIAMNISGKDGFPFIYFGAGTWLASAIFYGTVAVRQVVAFLIGLVVLHTGVLLIIKGELTNPMEFGFIMFVCGIFILLNSGFSEYMKGRKNK